ncbi:MAG: glycosyltransferase [Burkholderiales bacterium]|nr:glycosyltransferase [Burkholderiales bacterium]
MRLLHVIPSLDPRGGGPIEAVRQGGQFLKSRGHDVQVVTLDSKEGMNFNDFPLPVHALGPSRGHYRYSNRLVPWLLQHAPDFDAVVVNGLWQYHALGAWRAMRHLGRPYHVFTHGMLDPWFKQTYPLKHLKKWMYWPWADYRVLRDANGVLFTCEEERRLARQSFWLYRANEYVVAFGTSQPPTESGAIRDAFFRLHPELYAKRIVLFLGRIHEKKGCDLLVRAFNNVAAAQPGLHLVIAGPDDGDLRPALMRLATDNGLSDRITWTGMLQGDAKWGAFYASEVFMLPSHQENFGIAVVEALACQLPVLISDKVNIWREIEVDGAGLVAPDTAAGAQQLLQRWLDLPESERLAFRRRAGSSFARRFTVDAMAESLLQVVCKPSAAKA